MQEELSQHSHQWLSSAARLATPLLFASLGGYFSERGGIWNIALEGLILIGAFAAASGALAFHSPWAGVGFALLASTLFAALHGLLCIRFKTDAVVTGMGINLFVMGLAPVLSNIFFGMSGSTPMLEPSWRLAPWSLAGVSFSPLLLAAFLAAAVVWVVHSQTKFGQYLRFAGENPRALEALGISVERTRFWGVLLSGPLCALAGIYLAIDHGSGFSRNMTAGRGFIALAALILGRYTPQGALLGCVIFGFAEAAQIGLQGTSLPGGSTLPVQWLQALPYMITLFVLFFVGRTGIRQLRLKKRVAFASVIALCVLLTGCDLESVKAKVRKFLVTEQAQDSKKEDIVREPTLDEKQVSAEFVRELVNAVLMRELKDPAEFEGYINVLNQGGHYEGLYNGIVYSKDFKERETGTATVSAIRQFVDIMAQLYADQATDSLKKDNGEERAEEPASVRKRLESEAVTQSLFTLKRRLGEEVLKTIDLKKEYREKLATWFGKFTSFLNQRGVNFGFTQRNRVDEYYHYKWALEASEDRIKWETLNRVHMILNATGGSGVQSALAVKRGTLLTPDWEFFAVDGNKDKLWIQNFQEKDRLQVVQDVDKNCGLLRALLAPPFADEFRPLGSQESFEKVAAQACAMVQKPGIVVSALSSSDPAKLRLEVRSSGSRFEVLRAVVSCSVPEGKRFHETESKAAHSMISAALARYLELTVKANREAQTIATSLREKELNVAKMLGSQIRGYRNAAKQVYSVLTKNDSNEGKNLAHSLREKATALEKKYSESRRNHPDLYPDLGPEEKLTEADLALCRG